MCNKMTTVKFTGWKPGVRKIRFTSLLHEQGGMSLRDAKDAKDKIVGGGEVVEIDFKDPNTAKLIYEQASKIGVVCELI